MSSSITPGIPACPPGYAKRDGQCVPASAGTTTGPARGTLGVPPPPPVTPIAGALKPIVPTLPGAPPRPAAAGPRTGTPFCPPGSHFDPAAGGCVLDRYENPSNPTPTPIDNSPDPGSGVGTVPVCPPGQAWNAAQHMCVPEVHGGPAQPPIEQTTPGDCPPGMHWNPNAKECRPGPAQPPPTGGGGGGGGGGKPPSFDPGGTVSDELLGYLRQLLDSNSALYTGMKSKLLQATEGRRSAGSAQLEEDLARRHLSGSGIAARGNLDLANEASGQYSSGVRDIEINMKLHALDGMQKWLDSTRQFYLGNKQIEAQLKIAADKIAAEKQMLEMQLAHMGGGGGGGQDDFQTFLGMLNSLAGGG